MVVAACTTTVREDVRRGKSPIAVFLAAGQPLPREGSVLAFQVMTVDKVRLDGACAGTLTDAQLSAVDTCLRNAFGL